MNEIKAVLRCRQEGTYSIFYKDMTDTTKSIDFTTMSEVVNFANEHPELILNIDEIQTEL